VINLDLEELEKFIETCHGFIQETKERLDRDYEDLTTKMEEDDLYAYFEDKVHYGYTKLPDSFYKSAITVAYSIFEFRLSEIVKKACIYKSINLAKILPKNGPEISKYKHVIQSELAIDLSDIESTWVRIDFVRKVRNSIVHNDSRINTKELKSLSKDEKKIVGAVWHKNQVLIKRNIKQFYILEPDCVYAFIKEIKHYLQKVTERVLI
jgi:hypothetical protein